MSAARAIRERIARHYAAELAECNALWDGGRAARALEALREAWPQIQAQHDWVLAQVGQSSTARAVSMDFALGGRHILRTYLPARERRAWFERLRGSAEASRDRSAEATALCELAICSFYLGESARALECARAAQRLVGATAEPRLEGDVLWALGLALHSRGQNREAVEVFGRCVDLRRRALGTRHPEVIDAMNGMGYALYDLEDYRAIVDLLSPVAEPELELLEPHVNLAASYRLLGTAYGGCAELDRAERCCRRALEIDRKLLPPTHIDIARDLGDLGFVCRARGDLAGAVACTREALAIDEKAHGDAHPATALRMCNLGVMLREQGDPEAALRLLRRSADLLGAIHGERHPSYLNARLQLGVCLLELDLPEEAWRVLDETMSIRRELEGAGSPKLAAEEEVLRRAEAAVRRAREGG